MGYVIKFKSNYGNIQPNILTIYLSHNGVHFRNLYYGSSTLLNFIKLCKSRNINIRKKLSYNTHISYLGPPIVLLHPKQHLYIRHFRLLSLNYGMLPDYQIVLLKLVWIMTDLHQTL